MESARTTAFLIGILSLVRTSHSGYSGWGGQTKVTPTWSQVPAALPPEYESTPQRIVVEPGQTAVLPCRVRNLSDKVVSWMRGRDLHIISSGGFMFTADSRFQVVHPDGDSSAWSLQLRGARIQDQGVYECQVNTDPKMKRAVLLTVADKMVAAFGDMSQKDDSTVYGDAGSARIIGPKEKYVKIGSSLTLTCNFQVPPSRISPHASRLIVDWLHGEEAFTFGSGRGGVRIENNKDGSDVTSRLTLARVEEGDAGKYTCRPAHGRPATSTVIIVDGEHSEAMQGNSSRPLTMLPSSCPLTLLYLLLLCINRQFF